MVYSRSSTLKDKYRQSFQLRKGLSPSTKNFGTSQLNPSINPLLQSSTYNSSQKKPSFYPNTYNAANCFSKVNTSPQNFLGTEVKQMMENKLSSYPKQQEVMKGFLMNEQQERFANHKFVENNLKQAYQKPYSQPCLGNKGLGMPQSNPFIENNTMNDNSSHQFFQQNHTNFGNFGNFQNTSFQSHISMHPPPQNNYHQTYHQIENNYLHSHSHKPNPSSNSHQHHFQFPKNNQMPQHKSTVFLNHNHQENSNNLFPEFANKNCHSGEIAMMIQATDSLNKILKQICQQKQQQLLNAKQQEQETMRYTVYDDYYFNTIDRRVQFQEEEQTEYLQQPIITKCEKKLFKFTFDQQEEEKLSYKPILINKFNISLVYKQSPNILPINLSFEHSYLEPDTPEFQFFIIQYLRQNRYLWCQNYKIYTDTFQDENILYCNAFVEAHKTVLPSPKYSILHSISLQTSQTSLPELLVACPGGSIYWQKQIDLKLCNMRTLVITDSRVSIPCKYLLKLNPIIYLFTDNEGNVKKNRKHLDGLLKKILSKQIQQMCRIDILFVRREEAGKIGIKFQLIWKY